MMKPFCFPRESMKTLPGFFGSPMMRMASLACPVTEKPIDFVGLYVPAATRIVSPARAASIAFWMFLYLQPRLQTFSVAEPPGRGLGLPGSVGWG